MPGLSGLGVGGTHIHVFKLDSAASCSRHCVVVQYFQVPRLRVLRDHWLPPGHGRPHVALQSLLPAPSAPGPPPAFPVSEICLLLAPSHLFIVDGDSLCLFSFPINLIEHLGREGRHVSQLAKT